MPDMWAQHDGERMELPAYAHDPATVGSRNVMAPLLDWDALLTPEALAWRAALDVTAGLHGEVMDD